MFNLATRPLIALIGCMPKWLKLPLMALTFDRIAVQNLLASFCCALGKEILRHFSLLGAIIIATNFKFLSYIKTKTKRTK